MEKSINQLSKEINDNARSKGFWDKERNTGEMLMLIVSEIAEALEADRKDKYASLAGRFKAGTEDYLQESNDWFKWSIKDTFEDELADATIRIFDLAYSKGIDLQWHIERKMKFNADRPHMHGKKY